MNTETFRSYLVSESGRKRFVGQNSSIATPTNVTIIGGSVCADVTGCSCGNLRSSVRTINNQNKLRHCLHYDSARLKPG